LFIKLTRQSHGFLYWRSLSLKWWEDMIFLVLIM
jgi:hypothetical protein